MAVNICSGLLVLVISHADLQPLRVLLGLPFLILFPGYSLMVALFPKRSDLPMFERMAFSVGMSIALVPLIGLALNYAWEIRIYNLLTSLATFIAVTSAIGWYRRRRIPADERMLIKFRRPLFSRTNSGKVDRTLSVVLALAIMAIMGIVVYLIVTSRNGERFTEFYVLGEGGRAEEYPTQMLVGEEAGVTLGIVNHEQERMTYKVELTMTASQNTEIGPIELENNERWEQDIMLATGQAINDMKVSFRLFKIRELNAGSNLSTSLALWIGEEEMAMTVVNNGSVPASFEIRASITDTDVNSKKQKIAYQSAGPVLLGKGEQWQPKLEYPTLENTFGREVEFSLYRDGKCVYRETSRRSYPELHFWMTVAEAASVQ